MRLIDQKIPAVYSGQGKTTGALNEYPCLIYAKLSEALKPSIMRNLCPLCILSRISRGLCRLSLLTKERLKVRQWMRLAMEKQVICAGLCTGAKPVVQTSRSTPQTPVR